MLTRAQCIAVFGALLSAACCVDTIQPRTELIRFSVLSAVLVEESSAAGCQPWSWQTDHTTCINNTIAAVGAGGTVYFSRGETYNYGAPQPGNTPRIWVLAERTLAATGIGTRPILKTLVDVEDGIFIGARAKIVNLDIQGPHYGQSGGFTFVSYHGINGAGQSFWTVEGSSIDGFRGHGVLAGNSDSLTILNNAISHNAGMGVALYAAPPVNAYCGRGSLVVGNVIEYNGGDGIDACSSVSTYQGNTIRRNGWTDWGGDGNGILLCAHPQTVAEHGPIDSTSVIDNRISGNREHGIYLNGGCSDGSVATITIDRNWADSAGHNWPNGNASGIRFNGSMVAVSMNSNHAMGNTNGCWNIPYDGVTPSGNLCNTIGDVSISGPTDIRAEDLCRWTAVTNVEQPQYEWRVDGVLEGTARSFYRSFPVGRFQLTIRVSNSRGTIEDSELIKVSYFNQPVC